MKEIIIEFIYKLIKIPYEKFFKNNIAWNITIQDLIQYPQESLGFHLGCFLLKYDFKIQQQLEEHDVYHILTNSGITVHDEINMQFYLFGNGKRSPFVFIVIATGLLFYPFNIKKFCKSYKKGKLAHQFYDLNFLKMLPQSLEKIQKTFNIN